MNCKTIILRFRDLVTPTGETIQRHQEIIKSTGSVCWGWWAKPDEQVSGEFLQIQRYLATPKQELRIFLFDSGQSKIYEAQLVHVYLNGNRMQCPNKEKSPEYYSEQQYNMWFEFSSIAECDEREVQNYSYSGKITDFFEDPTMFSVFENKQVSSLRELKYQDRTIWFVDEYDPKQHESHEILLSNSNVSIPGVFPKRPIDLNNGKVIWLSDIHFDEENSKHQFSQYNQIELSKIIINKQELEIDGLVVSGDLTWKATAEEFKMSADFFQDICSVKRVNIEAIGFCPGNHDVSFSRVLPDDVKHALESYHESQMGNKEISTEEWGVLVGRAVQPEHKDNYERFFNSIVGTSPNEYLSMGKRFIIKNQKIVDFCFLNSNHLQQHKVAFQGQGFVGIDQLSNASKEMSWDGNEKISGGFRVVVLHHNLYPVNYTSVPYVSVPASLVYDTEAIIKWCFKHGVDLILHGHTHEKFITKVTRKIAGASKSIWIVGLGSSGVISSHLVGNNEFAEIDFNDDIIKIKFFDIINNEIVAQEDTVYLD
ncbi:TPA: metallophosphoesterase [Klebsiella pneumoniae]|uniref:metallophosphoesterase family protein n=1 Tax=Klebsiella pneumoniae TaxID=573 RepID=UPI00222EA33E|nr:metallophosphoesterase [Klebsiella pneumoniae]MDM8695012.1 metallophosphoesterase [Klebsiella pneumoniae]HBZ9287748.1 metallophosphoesterase [Klebsiella pneumoniae]HCA0022732.1 metallophosphoesterase [Klebsiella pneumoniae]HCA0920184.1 metallophosphoesterase [Klebsiella pneumoniae]HCA1419620.1 metallophosphoesterase [Klebsiella pneumoniae]